MLHLGSPLVVKDWRGSTITTGIVNTAGREVKAAGRRRAAGGRQIGVVRPRFRHPSLVTGIGQLVTCARGAQRDADYCAAGGPTWPAGRSSFPVSGPPRFSVLGLVRTLAVLASWRLSIRSCHSPFPLSPLHLGVLGGCLPAPVIRHFPFPLCILASLADVYPLPSFAISPFPFASWRFPFPRPLHAFALAVHCVLAGSRPCRLNSYLGSCGVRK